jgi:hypothetical protein
MEKRHFGSFPAQMEMRLIEATREAARDRQNQPTTSPPLRPAQWTMQRIAEALNVAQSTISEDLRNFSTVEKIRPKGRGRPKGSGKQRKPKSQQTNTNAIRRQPA